MLKNCQRRFWDFLDDSETFILFYLLSRGSMESLHFAPKVLKLDPCGFGVSLTTLTRRGRMRANGKRLGEELWFWVVCAAPTRRYVCRLKGVPPLRVPNPGAPCAPLCPSGTPLLFLGSRRSVLVSISGLEQEGAHASDADRFPTEKGFTHARHCLFCRLISLVTSPSPPQGGLRPPERERQALTE